MVNTPQIEMDSIEGDLHVSINGHEKWLVSISDRGESFFAIIV